MRSRATTVLPYEHLDRATAGLQAELRHRCSERTHGRPIDPRPDCQEWKALLQSAGVRDARLHDARHTAATLLLQQGEPARVAMEMIGHSHISLTLGTCTHVGPELAEDAAQRMGDALWG